MIRRFAEMLESTPPLRAAQRDMMDRLVDVAAQAMAARAGVDPEDPEPQIAADALLGLWRVQYRAMRKYSDGQRSAAEVRDRVLDEVRRAARLIDTGLWSFGMAVQGSNGREQLKAAAEAANEARKQVVTAIKQARGAWRQVVAEAHSHDEARGHPARSVRPTATSGPARWRLRPRTAADPAPAGRRPPEPINRRSAAGEEELLEVSAAGGDLGPRGDRQSELGQGRRREARLQSGPAGRVVGAVEQESQVVEGGVVAHDHDADGLGRQEPETVDDVVGVGLIEAPFDCEGHGGTRERRGPVRPSSGPGRPTRTG